MSIRVAETMWVGRISDDCYNVLSGTLPVVRSEITRRNKFGSTAFPALNFQRFFSTLDTGGEAPLIGGANAPRHNHTCALVIRGHNHEI